MKRLIFIFSLVVAFLIGAVVAIPASAAQDHPLKIWMQNRNGQYETLNVVDSKTGVNYVIVSGELYSEGIGIAICPRYNADGSLYVTP